jgi:hypothetical protein
VEAAHHFGLARGAGVHERRLLVEVHLQLLVLDLARGRADFVSDVAVVVGQRRVVREQELQALQPA